MINDDGLKALSRRDFAFQEGATHFYEPAVPDGRGPDLLLIQRRNRIIPHPGRTGGW